MDHRSQLNVVPQLEVLTVLKLILICTSWQSIIIAKRVAAHRTHAAELLCLLVEINLTDGFTRSRITCWT